MSYTLNKLASDHILDQFSCGVPSLDVWLSRNALNSERKGTATTYVWCDKNNAVVAYFALSVCSIRRDEINHKTGRGSPDTIPAIIVGKLALHQKLHGQGLGRDLLYSALETIVRMTDIITARLVVVDALNENVARFYEQYGFIPFMDSRVRLCRKTSDIRKDIKN